MSNIEIPKYYGFSWSKQRPDPKRCIVSVHDTGRSISFHQCNRKRGHGPDGLFCAMHDPAFIAKKDAERQKQWDTERNIRQREGNHRNVGARLFELNPEMYESLLKGKS